MKVLDDFTSKDIELFYSTNLDRSVYAFQNLVYEYLTEKEFKLIVLGTELGSLIENIFGPSLDLGNFSEISDSIIQTQFVLTNSVIVSDMLFFYGGIYSSIGNRKLFEELKASWEDHRNTIYRLASLFIIHLLGMFIVKENLC